MRPSDHYVRCMHMTCARCMEEERDLRAAIPVPPHVVGPRPPTPQRLKALDAYLISALIFAAGCLVYAALTP